MLHHLLRGYLTFGIGASEATVSGRRQPIGYVQVLAASLVSAFALKSVIPTPTPGYLVGYAVIQNNVAASSVRWRDDGTAPTTAIGMVLGVGELDYTGDPYAMQLIAASGSPILDISFYA